MQHKELILIGLGRMGLAMAAHLVEQGHTVYGFDVAESARSEATQAGVTVHETLEAAVTAMSGPKTVWIMVPSNFVDAVLADVRPHLTAGDTVIDGGNSFFKDSLRRHQELSAEGIQFVDAGVSGGVEGARHGASVMVGGERAAVEPLTWLFTALAIKNGYGHVGGPGAGHFVKMVHNGIEYGMMGAIAEGLAYIEANADELSIDVSETLKPYEHGSIISSSLVSWLADAYQTSGYLDQIAGEVPKGETEMEMEFIAEHCQTPVLQAALQQRQATREESSRIGTLISAMRNQFGGHKTIEKYEGTDNG